MKPQDVGGNINNLGLLVSEIYERACRLEAKHNGDNDAHRNAEEVKLFIEELRNSPEHK